MIERRLVGRRFIDFHPDAAHPLYPNELERRLSRRRDTDREGAPGGLDSLLPGRRRRPPLLWSGLALCSGCGHERARARNLSRDARRYFIVEHALAPAKAPCQCGDARAQIEWILQAGRE